MYKSNDNAVAVVAFSILLLAALSFAAVQRNSEAQLSRTGQVPCQGVNCHIMTPVLSL